MFGTASAHKRRIEDGSAMETGIWKLQDRRNHVETTAMEKISDPGVKILPRRSNNLRDGRELEKANR
jgi:hypothetical protein